MHSSSSIQHKWTMSANVSYKDIQSDHITISGLDIMEINKNIKMNNQSLISAIKQLTGKNMYIQLNESEQSYINNDVHKTIWNKRGVKIEYTTQIVTIDGSPIDGDIIIKMMNKEIILARFYPINADLVAPIELKRVDQLCEVNDGYVPKRGALIDKLKLKCNCLTHGWIKSFLDTQNFAKIKSYFSVYLINLIDMFLYKQLIIKWENVKEASFYDDEISPYSFCMNDL